MARRTRSHRFEMPYRSDALLLTDEAAGIDRIVLREAQPARTFTLLDSPDERLGWAGIQLVQQASGEQRSLALRAPGWQPWLEAEQVLDNDEVPADLSERLLPFLRRATIEPLAEVGYERAVYDLLDLDGVSIGQLLDDQVTTRRGGLMVGRHREVTLQPDETMSGQQRALLLERLHQVGSTPVNSYATPMARLAALTTPVEVPAEPPRPDDLSVPEFVEWAAATRLLQIWRADLAVRTGQLPDAGLLIAELVELADLVCGLEGLVDPVWAGELGWQLDRTLANDQIDDLGTPYYEVLDALAEAARSPRVVATDESARVALWRLASQRGAELVNVIDRLSSNSVEADWAGGLRVAQRLISQLNAGAPVLGRAADRRRRLTKLLADLGAATSTHQELDAEALAGLSPAQAYRAGREYERAIAEVREPRAQLLDAWPRTRERLLGAWPQLGEELERAELTGGQPAALEAGQ